MITGQTQAHSLWADLIFEYVRCNISFQKDRLGAISGLSRKLQRHFFINIHAGIPDEDTGDHLLWYTGGTPLRSFTGFHAPSWSWASLDGVVSFSMPRPRTKLSSALIRDLAFQTETKCEAGNPNGKCAGTCISGQVSFTCKIGKLYRCGKLREAFGGHLGDLFSNGDIMEPILGSAIRSVGHPLPRFDADGNEIQQNRQLFVPDHTELLKDEHSFILGFFVPDVDAETNGDCAIFCAGIKRWGPCNASLLRPFLASPEHSVPPEVSIDFIGLAISKENSEKYERIGRGRIICNSWLSTCEERRISII